MGIFSAAFKGLQGSIDQRLCWASCFFEQGQHDIETRMELAIRLMSPPVAHQLLNLLGSDAVPKVLEGLAAYWAVCMAGAQGWSVTDISEDSVVLAEKGERLVQIVPVVVDTLNRRRPQNQQISGLIRQLESVIHSRRFVLHIKQELPEDFDPLVLVHPVQNWMNEIDRGQWAGGYAIYEDNDVALELCLLDEQPVSSGGGLLFHVPPMETEHVLRLAIPQMVQAIERSRASELPTVVLMLGNERWHCNPAMMLNILYGRCVSKIVQTGGEAHFDFALSGLSLLANDICGKVGAVWWLEPSADNSIVRGVSHANPWSSVVVPRFVGQEFRGVGEQSDQRRVSIVKSNAVEDSLQLDVLRSFGAP